MRFLNEKGNTLLYVLMTITLLSVFGTVLSAQALSGNQQVVKTEGQQKATDAAEIGIDYFYKDFKATVSSQDLSTNTCNKLSTAANSIIQSRTIDTSTSYKITFDPDINKKCWYSSTDQKYKFSFYSTGTITEGGGTISEKTLTGTFPIAVNHQFPAIPEGFETCGENPDEPCAPQDDTDYGNVYFPNGLNIPNKEQITADSIYADQNLNINGFNNVDELIVTNDLFINGGSLIYTQANVTVGGSFYLNGDFYDQNHGDLIIKGNAYFYKDIYHMPNSFICVEGTLYKTHNSTFDIKPLTATSCEALAQDKKETGVYARLVDYIDSSTGSMFNDNQLEVDYTGN